MNRIKLPGSKKMKIILLIILVIIAAGVIIKFGIDNRKNVKEDIRQEQDSSIEEIISTNEEKNQKREESNPVNQEEENLYNEAYDLFFQGNYSEAINRADSIIEKFPESYKAYNIRGIAKAFSIGFEEGMIDIEKSLAIKGDYWYARYNKALNYELHGKLNESLVWYDKSLEIEPYMWSYYGKASIYGRMGDVDNTVLNLNKAIEVEGANEGESGIKKEAKTEKDFDPVRGNSEFEELIKDNK
ncbi:MULTISPECIES: hypothetical protein [Clostridium]|uniref:Tetratricopeptide repeat protein n=1 Tax=Clostridium cibarium TaxID=2762247 RepID=A0ABR8PYN6_9CLOT|nr:MULTISPECIES: hypothetical protein [Clostridium]MBD7913285.1 hypothetical protein [Clostridium cibarium]